MSNALRPAPSKENSEVSTRGRERGSLSKPILEVGRPRRRGRSALGELAGIDADLGARFQSFDKMLPRFGALALLKFRSEVILRALPILRRGQRAPGHLEEVGVALVLHHAIDDAGNLRHVAGGIGDFRE